MSVILCNVLITASTDISLISFIKLLYIGIWVWARLLSMFSDNIKNEKKKVKYW